MRYYWYGNRVGGFSNTTGIAPEGNDYKFIGHFSKECSINRNMYLLKCTDSETPQTNFQNPFTNDKRTFTKNDILKLYEAMDEMDEIIVVK